jgi:putative hydrolase of the HAD superfamily
VPVDAVIFDWGGTLSVWASLDVHETWRSPARHLAPEREDEITRALTELEAHHWRRVDESAVSFRLADLVEAALEVAGLEPDDELAHAAASAHLESWRPHIQHEADAADVLRALRDRGLAIGLLSNTHWPAWFHEDLLAADGLRDLIDVRCYTSDLDVMKPHPEAFRAVLDPLGVTDPSRAVFVGDRPVDDIGGAKALGMRAVLRRNPHVPHGTVLPDAEIDALSELVPLVDDWR